MAMAACSIFDEDEVCLLTSSGSYKYGLVIESSEYISSDEDEDDLPNRVQRGTVRVAWHPDGKENVVQESKLILADRSIMPGDVVRRLIAGQDSQRGFVQSLEVKCHVKIIGTEKWIYNVDSKDLILMQEWDPELEVTLDSWVGNIIEIQDAITLRFPDGARCVVLDVDIGSLQDVSDKRKKHTEFVTRSYYPGQELTDICEEDFENAEWLVKTDARNPKKISSKQFSAGTVMVEKVETHKVEVRWLCRGFTSSDNTDTKLDAPQQVIQKVKDIERMKHLDCFHHCSIQIGDKMFHIVKDTDQIIGISPRKHTPPDILQINKLADCFEAKSSESEVSSASQNAVAMENGLEPDASEQIDGDVGIKDNSDEYEDVEDSDDDGASSDGSHSDHTQRKKGGGHKRMCLQTRALKKLKGKKAKKKGGAAERQVNPGDKVPVEVWYTFTTASVLWQDASVEENIASPELFPIHHLDELEFFPGDFVVETKGGNPNEYGAVLSCDHSARTCMVKWCKPYTPGQTKVPEESAPVEVSVYDIKDHPDYKFRPGNTVIRVGGYENCTEGLEATGQVYRLNPGGTLVIRWRSGQLTTNYPQELFLISDELSDVESDEWTDSDEEEEEDEGSDVSWETENEEEVDSGADEEDVTADDKSKWLLNEGKRKELDDLLSRANTSLNSLLDIFSRIPETPIQNNIQVFQDILSIYRRCRELDRLLKSAFFDEPELTDLISQLRWELRKGKTSRLAQRVALVYENRKKGLGEKSSGDRNELSGEKEIEKREAMQDGAEKVEKQTTLTSDFEVEKCADKTSAKDTSICNNTDTNPQICDTESSVLHTGGRGDTHISDSEQALSSSGQTLNNTNVSSNSIHEGSRQCVSSSIPEKGVSHEVVNGESENLLSETGVNDVCNLGEADDKITGKAVEQETCPDDDSHKSRDVHERNLNSGQSSDMNSDCANVSKQVDETRSQSSCDENSESARTDSGSVQISSESNSSADIYVRDSPSDIPTTQSEGATGQTSSQTNSPIQPEGPTSNGLSLVQSSDLSESSPDQGANHTYLCVQVCQGLLDRIGKVSVLINLKCSGIDPDNKVSLCDSGTQTDTEQVESSDSDSKKSGEGGGGRTDECTCTEDTLPGPGPVSEASQTSDVDPEKIASVSEEAESKLETKETSTETSGSNVDGFKVLEEVSSSHRFKFTSFGPLSKSFTTAVRKEMLLLQSSLPEGILVKGFENRMDLFCVMITGPARTPYEDGIFAFDVKLPSSYPTQPPEFHYISYCSERLNPNLYEDGKVCVSLLGTWNGKGSEVWTNKSNMLQVLVSVQGLILVGEPYYNEAGYEKQRGTQQGEENSRMYNEMAILKLLQSMSRIARSPPSAFVQETKEHLVKNGHRMIIRIKSWVEFSDRHRAHCERKASQSDAPTKPCDSASANEMPGSIDPGFPLLPASKGFCLTMKKELESFEKVLSDMILKGEAVI